MPARPAIGITCSLERVRYGVWHEPAAFCPWVYVRAVSQAGGLPLLLAPEPAGTQDPGSVLDRVDGLLIAGGADVDPAAYGAEPHPETTGWVPERDRFELALAREAVARDLPLLGICRGMQVLNVAYGGTLDQHLDGTLEHHRRNPGTFEGNDHPVRLAPGSLAARAAGEEEHRTLSHHHQGLAEVGEGLVVTGWSPYEQLPEAVEDPSCRFVLGVQWHPEVDEASRVVAALVEDALAGARA